MYSVIPFNYSNTHTIQLYYIMLISINIHLNCTRNPESVKTAEMSRKSSASRGVMLTSFAQSSSSTTHPVWGIFQFVRNSHLYIRLSDRFVPLHHTL